MSEFAEFLESLEEKEIVLVDLRPSDFIGKPEVLNKYFVNSQGYFSKQFHIPVLTKELYENLVCGMTNVPETNRVFETASDYYKRKALAYMISRDLGCRPKDIVFKDYVWNEDMYKYTDELYTYTYMEDDFRDEEDTERNATTWKLYISDNSSVSLPMEVFDSLYRFCTKIIRKRLAIFFEIESCWNTLHSIIKSTEGFTKNPTEYQVKALHAFYNHFIKLASDSEVIEFTKEYCDINIYDKNDYIATYQRLARTFSGIKEGRLDYCRDVLNITEEEILVNEFELVEEDIVHENYDEECIEDKVLVY